MTVTPKGEPAAAIEYPAAVPPFCRGCGNSFVPLTGPQGSTPKIVDIAQVKAGWLAHGEFRPFHCTRCGQVYTELVKYIPIECASFPCPDCGPGSELTTEILSITETDEDYRFVALLKCDACSKQSRLSKLLGKLSKITKVKVGPTGVEVQVAP
jgi:uncharacterized Zn finger protein